METINFDTGFHNYWRLPKIVRDRGVPCSPRGQLTYDLGPTTIIMLPEYALPLSCGRNVAPRIAAVEALQLIGGFADDDLVLWASKEFERFTEPNGTFWGAYGERIGVQLNRVYHKLRADPDTRQAVITLWNPGLDNIPGKKDYPCTVALTFRIFKKRLELTTVMRSNDVWLGTPYDIFQFTQLQLTLADLLEVEAGVYRHVALSLHLYDDHVRLLDRLHAPTDRPFQPSGLAVAGDTFETMDKRAWQLVYQDDLKLPKLGESAQWYRDRVSSYHHWIEQKRRVERDKPYQGTVG